MKKKNWRSASFVDPRQAELFDDLGRDDPLAVFYRKIRKAGGWLTYDIVEHRVYAGHDNGVLGAWVVTGMRLLRDRIRADLLRVEHGIASDWQPDAGNPKTRRNAGVSALSPRPVSVPCQR